MNCPNCGAPMKLIWEKGHFRCDYCQTFVFPDGGQDGTHWLEPAPDHVRCPVCHIPLMVALFDDHYPGYLCQKCRGILLTRDDFVESLSTRRAWASTAPKAQQPMDPEDLQRKVLCPLCRQPMETHPYYGPGTFVIDSCVPCDVVWLDYGELDRAVDAPGRDRGSALRKKEEAVAKLADIEAQRNVQFSIDLNHWLLRLLR